MSCAQFASKLGRMAEVSKNEITVPVEAVMKHVESEAKRVLGTYEYGWEPLSERTIARHGDTPLLEVGQMKAGLQTEVEKTIGGAEGLVYSQDKVALWQEMGSVNKQTGGFNPPRSFLFKSLLLATPNIAKEFSAFALKLFTIR